MKRLFWLLLSTLAGHTLTVYAQTCDYEHTPADTPDSRYQINRDGTVTDFRTNLVWQNCPAGLSGKDCLQGKATGMNWQQALLYAEEQRGKKLAGYNDWRLPTIKELRTLSNRQCNYPAVNIHAFPNTPSYWYWSISPVISDGAYAWGIASDYGYDSWSNKLNKGLIRLVRTVR
jgi:hypothetical protein